jgi:nucleoside-diphosphate-sugar epimerase
VSRLLVTGAAGFVGAHVVRHALEAGHDVAAVVRPGGDAWRLRDLDAPMSAGALRLWPHELGEPASMEELDHALRRWTPDACIHLAWQVTPGEYLHSPQNVTCVSQSLALLERLMDAGCGAVVMAGTCAEYDLERAGETPLREDAPTRPATLYAAAKLALATVAGQWATERDIPFAWARLFYLHGPMEDERRMVPALIRSLLAGRPFPATAGEQVRDYLHVADVASALVRLAESRASGPVNIASGEGVAVRDLMRLVAELVGRTDLVQLDALPYRAWEPPYVCGDNTRLRSAGWAPRHTLRSGLADSIAWWRTDDRVSAPSPDETRVPVPEIST